MDCNGESQIQPNENGINQIKQTIHFNKCTKRFNYFIFLGLVEPLSVTYPPPSFILLPQSPQSPIVVTKQQAGKFQAARAT